MWSFIVAHQTAFALGAYYVASAFIGSLPAPQINSTQFYQFLFKFLNTLGGNLFRAFSSQLPVAQAQAQGVANANQTNKGQGSSLGSVFLVLAAGSCFFLAGCNIYTDVSNTTSVMGQIITIAQGDLPSLISSGVVKASDQPAISNWLSGLQTLDTQTGTCVASAHAAGDKKIAFLACFNTFAAGILTPAELADLRVISPGAQAKVELWATGLTLAVNTAISIAGGTPTPLPVFATAPARQDLDALHSRLNLPEGM